MNHKFSLFVSFSGQKSSNKNFHLSCIFIDFFGFSSILFHARYLIHNSSHLFLALKIYQKRFSPFFIPTQTNTTLYKSYFAALLYHIMHFFALMLSNSESNVWTDVRFHHKFKYLKDFKINWCYTTSRVSSSSAKFWSFSEFLFFFSFFLFFSCFSFDFGSFFDPRSEPEALGQYL